MNPSQRVDTVVIGGGVIGASTAWNLCRAGVGSVLLVERNTIGSGASAYAAGLVSHARSDADTLAMVRATLDDIATFEARTGEPVGFRRTGGLRIADTAETARQLRQMAALLAVAGVEFAFVEPAQARAMVPWLDAEGAHVILHLPGDGYVDGQNLAAAYARAAQADGAEV